jgi:SAM-dependent methyltransferase
MTKPLSKVISVIAKIIPTPKKVLEIGSWLEPNQAEYANLRPMFPNSSYLGIDMRDGLGVDQVVNADKLPFKDNSFDLVLCLETLEHADQPWAVASEIQRVVKKNGLIIASSQQNFPIHSYPSDYFRYTPYGMSSLSSLSQKLLFSFSPAYDEEYNKNPKAVILIGSKTKNTALFGKIKRNLKSNESFISLYKPIRHRIKDCIYFLKRAIFELHYHEKLGFFKD